MKRSCRLLLFLVCFAAALTMMFRAELWRVDAQDVGGSSGGRIEDGVPPAALLTERGRELAENLRGLRRTRANLGAKHPTLPVIEQAISETEQQLQAWFPSEAGSDNPFTNRDSPPPKMRPAKTENSAMNDADLRQLVLSLHAKIERLEQRVGLLEKTAN